MGHQIFEWVIAIAVLIVFISNLVFLWLIYSKLKPLIDKLQATSDRLNPILNEAQGIMSNTRDVVAAITPIVFEAQPVVRNIATKTNDITDMVHAQATEIRTLIRDSVLPTVRNQVERLDDLIKRTTDKIDSTTTTIEKGVIESIATKTNDITDMAHAQAMELQRLISDTILMVRNQVERLDNLVRRTTDTIDASIMTVTGPVREINYLGVAIRRGLSVLFSRDKKPS